jgi:hypothetical protein
VEGRDGGCRIVTKALLQPIHTLQSLSQSVNSTKSTARLVEKGQVYKHGRALCAFERTSQYDGTLPRVTLLSTSLYRGWDRPAGYKCANCEAAQALPRGTLAVDMVRYCQHIATPSTPFSFIFGVGRSSSPGTVKNFLFSTSSRPALGSTQPPVQWVPDALSAGVKRPRREVSAEVKKMWIYTSSPPYAFMA